MKRFLAAVTAVLLCGSLFCGCVKNDNPNGDDEGNGNKPAIDWFTELPEDTKELLSADGYVKQNIGDFSQYADTDAYRTVSTPDEFLTALKDAKYSYNTVWDDESQTYSQTLNSEGTVHVIEITADLNLGYYLLGTEWTSNRTYVEDYCRTTSANISKFTMSEMFTENGISKIKIENTSNLLVFSKNGAKLTHCGFSLLSCTNVVFRNIEMDEIWQWEDSAVSGTSAVGDYDAFGWAYFKVAHCGYVWIDHCTFGKSYDGQIDYSNPVYNTKGTAFRAPYGIDGANGLHISWCKFNAGSDDEDGYLYKMMSAIEQDYQTGGKNYLYYNALRNGGVSFEEILYGLAIPQKKGFLCGDSGNGTTDYDYNLSLRISFSNCVFKNLEDRIPKLRGGNAYMFNCLVDSSQYYEYRTKLESKGAAGLVARVSASWKCALVSQGIVCGNGGSVKAENCIFRGIKNLLKNNDSGGKTEGSVVRPVNGGYQLVNCSYQLNNTAEPSTTVFPNSSTATLKSDYFKWNTADGEQPFSVKQIELDNLEGLLGGHGYGAGVSALMLDRLLICDYSAKLF